MAIGLIHKLWELKFNTSFLLPSYFYTFFVHTFCCHCELSTRLNYGLKEDHFYYYFTQGFSIVTINTLQKYPRKSFFVISLSVASFFCLWILELLTQGFIYRYFSLILYKIPRWFTDRLVARLFKKGKRKRLIKTKWWFQNEQFTRRSNTVWISFNQILHNWLKTGGDSLIYSLNHLWKLPHIRQVHKKVWLIFDLIDLHYTLSLLI